MERYKKKFKEAKYTNIKYTDADSESKELSVLDSYNRDFVTIMFKRISFPNNLIFLTKEDAKNLAHQLLQESK